MERQNKTKKKQKNKKTFGKYQKYKEHKRKKKQTSKEQTNNYGGLVMSNVMTHVYKNQDVTYFVCSKVELHSTLNKGFDVTSGLSVFNC